MIGASRNSGSTFYYQTATTWPGLIIVLTGIPVYFIWRKLGVPMPELPSTTAAGKKLIEAVRVDS